MLDTKVLVKELENALENNKAQEILVLNVADRSTFCDYMLIASGSSSRHVGSLGKKLKEVASCLGGHIGFVEGEASGFWVVLDLFSVVVHIFSPEAREKYQLEKMWSVPSKESIGFCGQA